jgi:large subunit ribosomal protein L4
MTAKKEKIRVASKAKVSVLGSLPAGKGIQEISWQEVTRAEQLLAQAVLVESRRQRIWRAKTKDRAEARGGGAKPWKQKGTGRARHGSRRSPIWVGGGVTHGPLGGRKMKPRLTARLRRLALQAAFAFHIRKGSFKVLKISNDNKKSRKEIVSSIKGKGKVLLLVKLMESWLVLPLRNLSWVTVKPVSQVTCGDVLGCARVMVEEEALAMLKERIEPLNGAVK